jgi:hypothetical protein
VKTFPVWQLRPALIAAALIGVLIGAAVLVLPYRLSLALLGVAWAVALLWRRPELAILGLLILTSTFLDEQDTPMLGLGGVGIYLADLIVIGLFALILLRRLVEPETRLVRTALDLPLGLFFALILLTSGLAIGRGDVTPGLALTELRYMAYYAVFFLVTNLVRSEQQIRLLVRGVLLLAGLVALGMIAQFLLGDRVRILPGRVESLNTEGAQFADITRMLPPGESLLLTSFITLSAIIATNARSQRSMVYLLGWGLSALGVSLTFNRNFWIGSAMALTLIIVLVSRQERQRFLSWMLLISLLVALLSLPLWLQPESRAARLAVATAQRLFSLTSSETFDAANQNSTLRWRDFEYLYALPAIGERPLIGHGMGAQYRPSIPGIDWAGFDGRGYIHNAHLGVMIKAGVPGYLSLIWFIGAFLYYSLRTWTRLSDPLLRGVALGFGLTGLAVLIGSLVNPMLMQWYWTPLLGVIIGVNARLGMLSPCGDGSARHVNSSTGAHHG